METGCPALPCQKGTVIAVELDRSSLNDVGVLPQTGFPLVDSDCGRVVRSHGVGGHMDRRSGSQKRAARLLLKFVVSALDVSFSEGITVGAIDADGAGGRDHGALGHARAAAQRQIPV